jgi:hypothetical protein
LELRNTATSARTQHRIAIFKARVTAVQPTRE